MPNSSKIDNAIANGVWFLKDHQLPDGTWPSDFPVGYTALGGLTLLECGVPSEDTVVRKAAEYVRQHAVLTAKSRTYEWALAILFLDRLGQKSDEKLIQHVASYPAAGGNLTKDQKSDEKLIQYLALCLIAGQSPETDFWGYASPVLDAALVPATAPHAQGRQTVAGRLAQSRPEGSSLSIRGLGQLQHAVRHPGPVGRQAPRGPHRQPIALVRSTSAHTQHAQRTPTRPAIT